MSEEEKAIKRLEEMTKNYILNSEDLHYAIILYYLIINLQKENKQLKEHIEKYERYCKTTGIKELQQNIKYKEIIDKAIEYLEGKRIREKAIVDIDVLEGILKEVE